MGFVTEEQKALLNRLRRRQNREWAARSPSERLDALCALRAEVVAAGRDLADCDSDEPPDLLLAILARRRKLAAERDA